MGVGSLRVAGEERAGDGIPKGAGTRRNKTIFLQHCTIVCDRQSIQTRELLWKGVRNREYKVWETGNSDTPTPKTYLGCSHS